MLSELHSLNLKLYSKQYNKNFVLHLIVAPQQSSRWWHNYSTKPRQAGHADEQSMYSLMSMAYIDDLTEEGKQNNIEGNSNGLKLFVFMKWKCQLKKENNLQFVGAVLAKSYKTSGLYYTTIVNYASSVVNKLEALLTDDARVIIYDLDVFIVQAREYVMYIPLIITPYIIW